MTTPSLALGRQAHLRPPSTRAVARSVAFPVLVLGLGACLLGYAAVAFLLLRWVLGLVP